MAAYKKVPGGGIETPCMKSVSFQQPPIRIRTMLPR